jgi:hypothetical protein
MSVNFTSLFWAEETMVRNNNNRENPSLVILPVFLPPNPQRGASKLSSIRKVPPGGFRGLSFCIDF